MSSCDLPTILSKKHARLLCFGAWLVLNADVAEDMRNVCFAKLKLFDNVYQQTQFCEIFYNDEKMIAKAIRILCSEKMKESANEKIANIGKNGCPLSRNTLLKHAFIDNMIYQFTHGRTNNFILA
jgi:hypothetical protein